MLYTGDRVLPNTKMYFSKGVSQNVFLKMYFSKCISQHVFLFEGKERAAGGARGEMLYTGDRVLPNTKWLNFVFKMASSLFATIITPWQPYFKVFERSGQTMDNLCLFGSSRSSNEFKIIHHSSFAIHHSSFLIENVPLSLSIYIGNKLKI